jgi:acetyl-CoA synthetase
MDQIKSFDEYKDIYEQSIKDPEKFWAAVAEDFHWQRKWDTILKGDFHSEHIRWYDGGICNLSENCIDRHLASRGDQTAIIWEPNDPKEQFKTLTYSQLHEQVSQFANVLKGLGIKKGDRVCIYLPMILEGAVAMLACARIGAIHSVVFAGFSAQSIIDRVNDSGCSLIITADAVYRGDKKIELKKIVDDALDKTPTIKNCIVFNHRNSTVNMKEGRDLWWHEEAAKVSADCPPEEVGAEDALFILYTSGSTGKPKGVLHTTGGYMVYAGYTFKNVFNYRDKEVFCCTADIGWVTGHSYLVYGPLLNGGTTIMFEGIPTYPDHGRFWDLIDKHKVNIFYTAPTAIRSLQSMGSGIFVNKDLSSLRVLGSVGEPINEEAWHWYHEHVGKGKCDIVDTWWQTETGGIMISPIATVTPMKPAFASLPLPGVQLALLDDKGNEIQGNDVQGNLCIKFPWPGLARTVYGDHERFRKTYFSTYPGYYFTSDGCRRDADGYYRITGRVDDVINVSGHRIGTGELEDAINEQGYVVESAVVGYPHDIKGQGIYAFVICDRHIEDQEELIKEIKEVVGKSVGPFAKPDKIQIIPALPKTRSGKIMRRILRRIAEGDVSNLGDTSTLLDPSVVDKILAGRV